MISIRLIINWFIPCISWRTILCSVPRNSTSTWIESIESWQHRIIKSILLIEIHWIFLSMFHLGLIDTMRVWWRARYYSWSISSSLLCSLRSNKIRWNIWHFGTSSLWWDYFGVVGWSRCTDWAIRPFLTNFLSIFLEHMLEWLLLLNLFSLQSRTLSTNRVIMSMRRYTLSISSRCINLRLMIRIHKESLILRWSRGWWLFFTHI